MPKNENYALKKKKKHGGDDAVDVLKRIKTISKLG